MLHLEELKQRNIDAMNAHVYRRALREAVQWLNKATQDACVREALGTIKAALEE